MVRPCFKSCGRNFQICSNAMIVYTTNVSIGDNVYIAYGCWVQGLGGITLENEVMLGPYTVLTSTNHGKKEGSYRFGVNQPAPILLKRGSWTGAHVVITAGTTIGEGTACVAGAVVTKNMSDHMIVGGVPAKAINEG